MIELIKNIFKKRCLHEFYVSKIYLTNIPEKPKPETDNYFEWQSYYDNLYDHPSIAKRVGCKCNKCHETFFADCGLSLKGKLVSG